MRAKEDEAGGPGDGLGEGSGEGAGAASGECGEALGAVRGEGPRLRQGRRLLPVQEAPPQRQAVHLQAWKRVVLAVQALKAAAAAAAAAAKR